MIEGNNYGWASGRILACFAVAAVGLVAFVVLERRQRVPMLDLSLFRNAHLPGANVTMLLVALAMFGVFFFNSLYLRQVLGYSPIQTGATFLPMTVLIVFVAPLAGKTSDRLGSRGVYVFSRDVLFEIAERDTAKDFGREVIPSAL